MQTELAALDAVRAAARPGIRVSELASVFEQTIRDDGWSSARRRSTSTSTARGTT